MGTQSELGSVVFTNPQQIRLMEAIKERYQRAFSNALNIEPSHQRIPELLDINRQEEKPYFSWMSKKQSGYLPKKLKVEQLDVDYFRGDTTPYSISINGNLTDDLIASGMRYIQQMENKLLERIIGDAFANIHRPDYYLISMICERIKVLCKTSMTPALMNEYACLEKFMDSLTEIVNDYFPASFFEQRQAFHAYLENGVKLLKRMQERARFELDRSAISEEINRLKCHVENYQGKLALFLAYCMTDTELSNALSLGQLQNGDSLPASFADSPLYRNIHERLKGNILAASDNDVSEKTAGLSTLLRKRYKEYPEDMRIAFRAYQQLLTLLSTSFSLATQLGALSQHAQWKGEYEVVHDKTLSFLLKTYLKLIHAFVLACQQYMNNISEQNTAALVNREKITGAAKNGKRAARIANNLSNLSEQMQVSCDAVKKKIKKIKKENAKTLNLQQNTLLLDTECLLTTITKNAILADSAELLATLQRRCKTENESIDSVPYTPVDARASAKNNRKTAPNPNSIVRKKKVGSLSTLPIEAAIKKAADSVPAPARRTPVIVRESPVAAIHLKLEEYPQAKADFDKKVAELYHETDYVFPELLRKIQRIYILHVQLSEKLKALEKLNETLEKPLLSEIIEAFNLLKESIADATYAGVSFENFNFIKKLAPLHLEEKTKRLREINRILTPYYPSSSETHNQFYTPAMEAYKPVREEAQKKSEPTLRAFRELFNTIEQTSFPLNKNVTDYYESVIEREKLRLSVLDSTLHQEKKDPESNREIVSIQTGNEAITPKPAVIETASQTVKHSMTTNSITTPSTQPPFGTQEITAFRPSSLTESILDEKTTAISTTNGSNFTQQTSSSESLSPLTETPSGFSATPRTSTSHSTIQENVVVTEIDPLKSIGEICRKLRSSNNDRELRDELNNLYTQLSQYDYQVSTYFFGLLGGKTFYGDGCKKLVTTTAFAMLSYYEQHIKNNSEFNKFTLDQKRDHVNALLSIPEKSTKKFFSIPCCGFSLFQPRYRSMQQLYKAMGDTRPASSTLT